MCLYYYTVGILNNTAMTSAIRSKPPLPIAQLAPTEIVEDHGSAVRGSHLQTPGDESLRTSQKETISAGSML